MMSFYRTLAHLYEDIISMLGCIYMRLSTFYLLTKRENLLTLVAWKVIVIMTCSTTADVRALLINE